MALITLGFHVMNLHGFDHSRLSCNDFSKIEKILASLLVLVLLMLHVTLPVNSNDKVDSF